MTKIESKVCGIPCIIAVHKFMAGSYSYAAGSDVDYYGASEWEILDRRGRPAPWLERKVTPTIASDIEAQINSVMGE